MNSYFQSLTTAQKLISVLFIVLFLWSAIIQLNDPDPYHWFAIYFIVALMHGITMIRRPSKGLLWFVIIALVGYSLFHFNAFIDYLQIEKKNEIFSEMVYDKPYLEGTREFLGLLICAFSLTYHLRKSE